MRKNKILKTFFLMLILLFALAGGEVKAEDLTFDPDGYWSVSTYEDLEKTTDYNWPYRHLRLSGDIIVSDSQNDRELFFNGTEPVIIDLNGYTIERNARSLDTSLFYVQNGAKLTILDSSEGQTGKVSFINDQSRSAYTYRVGSSDSWLSIYGGTHTVKSESASYSANISAEGGTVEIHDGVFDCRMGSGIVQNITLGQLNHLTAAPRCIIYDGTFYAKYNNLDISPMSILQGDIIYSAIYVLDGDFYLSRYDEDANYGGFAYCNNGWGNVIVAGGRMPDHSLNKDGNVWNIDGALVQHANYTFEECTQIYETIQPPPVIVGGMLTKEESLLMLCMQKEAKIYMDKAKPGGTFDKTYGDALREILAQRPEIYVDENTYESPELKLEGVAANDKIRWYGAYDFDGENATWGEITEQRDNAGPWHFDIRPEARTTYYVRVCVERKDGSSTEDMVVIEYEAINKVLQGRPLIYMNNPYFGNRLYAGIFEAPAWQKKESYTYEWKLDGEIVGTEEIFVLDDPAYVGKSLNCTIRSTECKGELTTNTVMVHKKMNGAEPLLPNASFDAAEKNITLEFLRSDQEYLFTNKKTAEELTQEDWRAAIKPENDNAVFKLSDLSLEEYEGETIRIFTRYQETDTTRAGEKAGGISLFLAEKINLQDLIFRDSVGGKIYIPFTGKGEEVILYYDLDPINANQWNSFTWINPGWPVILASPIGSVNAENNTGTVRLELVSTGTTELTAYSSNGNQVKRQTIVVYDPENPSIGSANIVRPMQDHVMEAGTVYVSEFPQMIPQPPASMEFCWYFTDLTQYDQPVFDVCEIAKINCETGEIQALLPGTLTVALMKKNGNDFYRMGTFELTILDSKQKVPVTDIFSDVYNDWYTPYVQYVYDHDLMTGIKGTDRFEPNANITKAQVAQVLYNMDGKPVVLEKPVFTQLKDVYAAEWYADAVAWAYNTGVVTGDLNTKKFSPNANVTREQLALMMYRYAKYKGYDVSATSDFAGLVNAHKVADWSVEGVRWAVGAGLISGVEKNGVKDLAPQGNASRAQVAAILQRFCENVK